MNLENIFNLDVNFEVLDRKNIFYFKSSLKGPKVCILAGVHGNEKTGIFAIKEILKEKKINLLCGEIIFIFANPKAIKENKRFVEENLNRCFLKNKITTNSYEEKLSKNLKKILINCDICLDLHSSFVKDSIPFIICEKNSYNLIKNFPIKKVCSGFDKIEPGGTDYFMNLNKKKGICLELGFLNNLENVKIAKECVYTLLFNLNMIKLNFNKNTKNKNNNQKYKNEKYKNEKREEKEFLKVEEIYLTKNEFKLKKEFKDFEKIKKNQIIGYENSKKIKAKKNCFILFAKEVKKNDLDKECFLLGKTLL